MNGLLDALDSAAGTNLLVTTESTDLLFHRIWTDAGRRAAWFRHHTDRPVVGILLENTVDSITNLLAGWRAGMTMASLPLPPRGATTEDYVDMLGRALADADGDRLLAEPGRAELLSAAGLPATSHDEVRAPAGSHVTGTTVGHPGLIQFSSGSTGDPKGICLPLDHIDHNVRAILERVQLQCSPVIASWLPLSHDMGLIGMLLSGLAHFGHHPTPGGRIVLASPQSTLRRPDGWLRLLSETRATISAGPPFMLQRELAGSPGGPGGLDLTHLETLILGAEPIPAALVSAWEDRRSALSAGPHVLRPAYGLAEATLAVTMLAPHTAVSTVQPDGWSTELVRLGAPLDGTEVAVADDGRISVRGPSLLERYTTTPADLTDGWFETSDLGAVIDGELCVFGRADDVIISRGRNIFPADIEAASVGCGVRRGCVTAFGSADGTFVVVAELETGTTAGDAAHAVLGQVTERIGIRPEGVVIIGPGTFPRTPSGKARSRVLRSSLAAGLEVLHATCPTPTIGEH